MSTLLTRIQESVSAIQQQIPHQASIAIVLGSGLGSFTRHVEILHRLPYSHIPHFPQSTVEGHSGELILGRVANKFMWILSGRFHYYEGYSMQEVTFPIRVIKQLGVQYLLLSNAAGGLNPQFKVGDLMVITDHINLQPEHPLRGRNEDALGPRFPDMSEPYSQELISRAFHIAAQKNILLRKGVYVGVQGPSFETRAEYRYLHLIGGDAVGMSTVPETIVAVHMGIKVFAMSVITDIGIRLENNVITHEEVLEAARASEPTMSVLFIELIKTL
ncbi:MAG: purine-nucleoside phosphorylase [Thermoflavifilum sp.]|nr:purine-nucleoside phosphorylase [Thermoflavifilum sp.]